METPWKRIGVQHIHPDDAKIVRQHNSTVETKRPLEQVQRELPPLPYIGNLLTARVVLLGKNASYADIDEEDVDRIPSLMEENFKSLTFESQFPFFYLDERFASTNGYQWWWEVLEPLLVECASRGVDFDTILSRIACAQYHPYRSRSAFTPKERFPTQEFTFSLVREATKRPETVFVLLYGTATERSWRAAVPELPTDCIHLKSAQTAILSSGNMSAEDWDRVVKTLL